MSGPLGVADYEPRTLRAVGPALVPIVGGVANLSSRPVPPGETWRVNAVVIVLDGFPTAVAAGTAADSVSAAGVVVNPGAGAAIATLAGLTVGASYAVTVEGTIGPFTGADLQFKNGAAVVGSIGQSSAGVPFAFQYPRITPTNGTLTVNAIAGNAAATYQATIVATLIPAPAVIAAVGTAIISTGAAGDWTQGLFTVPVSNGIGYWEPRRLVLGDGAVITARLSGVTVAANARMDLMIEPIDYLPERTPFAHTPMVIEPSQRFAEGDALHAYDPTMQEMD